MATDDERTRRIQAALDDFRDMLARVPVVGVAHWSELEQLTDLIGRHTAAARRILAEMEEKGVPPHDPPSF